MRMISNEIIGGKAIITTEESKFVFWKKQTKFVAEEEFAKGYWKWLELPNFTLVPDRLSFQLDAWNRL